jgi:hypothetical protein
MPECGLVEPLIKLNIKKQNIGNSLASQRTFDSFHYLSQKIFSLGHTNAPLSSLMDSTMSPKVKTSEGEEIGACSLAHSTSGVEGHVVILEWGLQRLIS